MLALVIFESLTEISDLYIQNNASGYGSQHSISSHKEAVWKKNRRVSGIRSTVYSTAISLNLMNPYSNSAHARKDS